MNFVKPQNLHTVSIIGKGGKFRFITKCRAGFMSCHDAQNWENQNMEEDPGRIPAKFKKGALYTVQYQTADSDVWQVVWAKKGKNIIIADEKILADLKIGTVNQFWFDTNIYKTQMNMPNTGKRTWADLALVA